MDGKLNRHMHVNSTVNSILMNGHNYPNLTTTYTVIWYLRFFAAQNSPAQTRTRRLLLPTAKQSQSATEEMKTAQVFPPAGIHTPEQQSNTILLGRSKDQTSQSDPPNCPAVIFRETSPHFNNTTTKYDSCLEISQAREYDTIYSNRMENI